MQAYSRRWLTKRGFKQAAVSFYFDEKNFRCDADFAPALDEAQLVDVIQQTSTGLRFAFSMATTDWLAGLIGDNAGSEGSIQSFLVSLLHTAEHPLAQLIDGYCKLIQRLFLGDVNEGSRNAARARTRLASVTSLVQTGLKRTHEIIQNIFPALQQPKQRSLVVRCVVLDELTSRLSAAVLMPIVRAAHSPDDEAYAAKLDDFSEFKLHQISRATNLPERFWLRTDSGGLASRMRYASAVRALATLPSLPSSMQKIAILPKVLTAIQQSVLDYYSRLPKGEAAPSARDLQLTTDDFISVLAYVIVHARTPHFHSELAFLEKFTEESLLTGELGHGLATFQTAMGFLKSLTWGDMKTVSAPFAAPAAAGPDTCSGEYIAEESVDSASITIDKQDQASPTSPSEQQPQLQQKPVAVPGDRMTESSPPPSPSKVKERLLRARAARATPSASRHSLGGSSEGGDDRKPTDTSKV